MSEVREGNGQCLCGAVSVKVSNLSRESGACHCDMCRRWGGGPFMAVDCGSEVKFDGEDNVSVFDSSDWADRGFCNQCGTHLFYRVKEKSQYFLPAGLFQNDDFVLDHQVFIDEKPNYYSFANETKDMTGPELFAMFANPPG